MFVQIFVDMVFISNTYHMEKISHGHWSLLCAFIVDYVMVRHNSYLVDNIKTNR